VFSAAVFWFTWPGEEYMPDIERRQWKHLDYLGSFLLIAASVLICFAFQNAGIDASQWDQAVFLAPILLGILSAGLLFAWSYFIEKRWDGKLAAAIPMQLIRNQVYTAGVLNTMFLGFPYLMCIYSFPIRFQIVHRKSALQAGLMLLPMLAASAVGSTLAGALSNKKNRIFETMVAACLLMLIGCALETSATPSEAYEPKVLGFLVFIGLGFGMSASASTMLGATEAPIREHGKLQCLF
jgi:predicted membrane channel-forming protein YqfA (hemolysin III family)